MSAPLRPGALRRGQVGWVYLASFVSVGLALTIIGPSLSYLRDRAGVSNGDIAALFPASSIGYLIGSAVSGRFYDRGFGHRAVAGGLIGLSAAELLVPHVTSVSGLAVVFALVGMCAGTVDVGGNTLVLWHTRGSGSSRLLNALHLCFGVGALLCPVLVDRSIEWTGGLGFAAGFIAVYSTTMAVIVLLHEMPVHTEHDHLDNDAGASQTPTRILVVIAFFFVIYVGIEIGFSGWLKTYAEGIDLPGEHSPTALNTLFFISFTLGRLIAVTLAKRVRPGVMLAVSCGATSVFLAVMAIADGSPPFVWGCTALIGVTIAPQFATMIAYAEAHIALSGRATAYFVGAAGFGGLLLPWLIGQLLEGSTGAMPIAVFVGAVALTSWVAVVRRALVHHRNAPVPVPGAPSCSRSPEFSVGLGAAQGPPGQRET